MDVKCPFVIGTKNYINNQTHDDQFLPPVPNELYVRIHKEDFGIIKGTKKWTKLFTQDICARVKK